MPWRLRSKATGLGQGRRLDTTLVRQKHKHFLIALARVPAHNALHGRIRLHDLGADPQIVDPPRNSRSRAARPDARGLRHHLHSAPGHGAGCERQAEDPGSRVCGRCGASGQTGPDRADPVCMDGAKRGEVTEHRRSLCPRKASGKFQVLSVQTILPAQSDRMWAMHATPEAPRASKRQKKTTRIAHSEAG